MEIEELKFEHPLLAEIDTFLSGNEKVRQMFRKCFFSTIERSTQWKEGKEPFVLTGDIPAMWLRDSSAEVWNYLRFVKDVPQMKRFVSGVLRRQIRYVLTDPYANAFDEYPNGNHCWCDITAQNDLVWERKYEIDSLAYVVRLLHEYCVQTGELPLYVEQENPGENRDAEADASVGMVSQLFRTILNVWRTEQRHFKNSEYRFTRKDTWERDTIHNDGMGNPVNDTGMTWSGFRPSDDACIFGYLIPSNFFAVTALGYMEELSLTFLKNYEIAGEALELRQEILRGIRNYGTYLYPGIGRIYAYETDGYGNYILIDDANAPSLLSLPYLSGEYLDEEIYQNTRKFILSRENPNYYSGSFGSGIGSQHTAKGCIWPIALAVQALTSNDKEEIRQCFRTLITTDADTNYMHESFDTDNPASYTRPWFSWADSMFAELVFKLYEDENLRDILTLQS